MYVECPLPVAVLLGEGIECVKAVVASPRRGKVTYMFVCNASYP